MSFVSNESQGSVIKLTAHTMSMNTTRNRWQSPKTLKLPPKMQQQRLF
jgi:hypothetical protein